jgi:hypothetical protein
MQRAFVERAAPKDMFVLLNRRARACLITGRRGRVFVCRMFLNTEASTPRSDRRAKKRERSQARRAHRAAAHDLPLRLIDERMRPSSFEAV